VNDAGNFYLDGSFYFGPANFGGVPLFNAGATDIYVASFDPEGNHRWSERFGDTDFQTTLALDVRALPNPFNPTTSITYSVPKAGRVSLCVFDNAGHLVKNLVDHAYCPAGTHTAEYRACGPSGVYLVRLEAGGTTRTTKIVLVE
jgi:hypothetical protein